MIELRNLCKRMGESMILNQANLRVERGQCVAIVGPSGSGKTTLLRLIAGLEQPDSGAILLRGLEASRAGWRLPAFERALGFQFQDSTLWPHLSLLENLTYGLQGDKRRAMECLRRAGIGDQAERRPAQVSGGEARRAALARALAPGRDIVLLDEPLTNLEASLRAEIGQWIAAELQDAQATCLWVTHSPAETAGIAQRTLFIEGGQLHEHERQAARP